jgi:hypothetical protein
LTLKTQDIDSENGFSCALTGRCEAPAQAGMSVYTILTFFEKHASNRMQSDLTLVDNGIQFSGTSDW